MTVPATPAGQANPDPGAAAPSPSPAAPAAPAAAAPAPAAAAAGGTPTPEPAGTAAAAAAAAKAPEKYELVVPKGAEVFVDQSDLDAWSVTAKANGWTNEQAQAHLEAQTDIVAAKLLEIRAVTEADPEYGGKNLEANQQAIRRVIDRVRPKGHARTEGFTRLLTKTGLGNHVELFAFLADLGKLMAEDKPPSAAAGGGTTRDQAEVLYGAPKT